MQLMSNQSLLLLGVLIAGVLLTLYITRRRARLARRVGRF